MLTEEQKRAIEDREAYDEIARTDHCIHWQMQIARWIGVFLT